MGDQLESVNTPRSRDERALRLMRHLNRFIDVDAPTDELFDDDDRVSGMGRGWGGPKFCPVGFVSLVALLKNLNGTKMLCIMAIVFYGICHARSTVVLC